MNRIRIRPGTLAAVVTPEELRAVMEAAASHPTYPGLPATLAPVIDIHSRLVIA